MGEGENSTEPRRGGVVHVEIGPNESGQRVDNFLLARLKGVPRSRIYRLMRRGEVRVNGGRVKPAHRLQTGDRVRIPPVRTAQRETPAGIPAGAQEQLLAAIVHEDEDYLVLDKPAGVAVHGGSGVPWGLIEALRAAREDDYLELGHRLDRETSGCLVLARNRQALLALQAAMQAPETVKRYLLLVRGGWPADAKRVEAPLSRNVSRGGERLVAVDPEGKPAATRFRVLESYPGCTLLEAVLETGRTHQIRVHAAHMGCPVAGDERYGDGEFNRRLRASGLKRPFLHAQSLSLRVGARELDVETALPGELRAVLAKLSPGGDTPDAGASR